MANKNSRRADLARMYKAVDNFAAKMKAKLAGKYDEGYRGWDDPEAEPDARLLKLLRRNLKEGDYVDVANLCMFMDTRSPLVGKG